MEPISPVAEVQIAVDVVIFTIENDALKVVLVTREDEPFAGAAALPGGFLRNGETTRQAAGRILRDKVGTEDVYTEQLYTFDSPLRDPRGRIISVAYFALVPQAALNLTGPAVQHPRLVSANSLSELAFDHAQIVTYATSRLWAKLTYTNAAYSLLPRLFSLSSLQQLYETVSGIRYDKRNFRKKILSLGVIEQTTEQSSGGRHRPARLYRFVSTEPTELSERAFTTPSA